MAAILYVFKCGTLRVAIFLRSFSKLWTRQKFVFQCLVEIQRNQLIASGRKIGPRLQKKSPSLFSSWCRRSLVRPPAGARQQFSKLEFLLFWLWLIIIRKNFKQRKWLNILLTPWCPCYKNVCLRLLIYYEPPFFLKIRTLENNCASDF